MMEASTGIEPVYTDLQFLESCFPQVPRGSKSFDCIVELQSAGLVEYDHDQQTLRLVGWFYSLNGPDNGNQMKGHIKSFLGLSRCAPEIYWRAVAEFTVASFALALHWDNESPEHRKVNDAFRAFLKPMYFKYGEEFCAVLANEINSFEKGAYAPIQAVFHLLPGDGPEVVPENWAVS